MSDPHARHVAAVILAAGEGTRFGGPKALARLGDATFLEVVVRNLREVAGDIVVVGGAEYAAVADAAERFGARPVLNPDWPKGQFTSLKAGLTAVSADAAAFLIALVDHPMVKPDTYRLLHDRFIQNPEKILIPVFGGRRGHPVLIPSRLRNKILDAPDDMNLREILKDHTADIVTVDVADPGILRDIDTPWDLAEARP